MTNRKISTSRAHRYAGLGIASCCLAVLSSFGLAGAFANPPAVNRSISTTLAFAGSDDAAPSGSMLADVVTAYYASWRLGDADAMWQLLSRAYRAKNPKATWLRSHQLDPSLRATDAQVDGKRVTAIVSDADGSAVNRYRVTWTLVNEDGNWRLDRVKVEPAPAATPTPTPSPVPTPDDTPTVPPSTPIPAQLPPACSTDVAHLSSSPASAEAAMPELTRGALRQSIVDPNQLGYVLATAEWETGHFQTMHEYYNSADDLNRAYDNEIGNGAYPSNDGFTFRGRGFVQLTGRANYARMGKLLGRDLITNPDDAADPFIAGEIAALGMSRGLFTGVDLNDYVLSSKVDFIGARSIVNDHDQAQTIADYARGFAGALAACGGGVLHVSRAAPSAAPPIAHVGRMTATRAVKAVSFEASPTPASIAPLRVNAATRAIKLPGAATLEIRVLPKQILTSIYPVKATRFPLALIRRVKDAGIPVYLPLRLPASAPRFSRTVATTGLYRVELRFSATCESAAHFCHYATLLSQTSIVPPADAQPVNYGGIPMLYHAPICTAYCSDGGLYFQRDGVWHAIEARGQLAGLEALYDSYTKVQ